MRSVLCAAMILLLAGAATASSGPAKASGPHDVGETDLASYWLPRHRDALRAQRWPQRATAPAPLDRRAIRFRKAIRISHDLLSRPPVNLPTAQAETQTEPFLAVNPEDADHLIAVWQETRFIDGGARALGFATSKDGGVTWVEGLLPGITVIDGGTWDRASDPWVAFGPGGRAYFASLLIESRTPGNAIAVSTSTDGGLTWGPPVQVARDSLHFNDKEAIVADAYPRSRHRGNVYVAWDLNLSDGTQFVAQRLQVSRSTDGGVSWAAPVALRLGDANIGAVPVVAPDGTLHVMWVGGDSNDAALKIFTARSEDGGRTFTAPLVIAEMLATGARGYRGGYFTPPFAVDPASGSLYAAWTDSRFTGVDQVGLSASHDGGATWSLPVRVSDGADDVPVITPSVAVNDAGVVGVGYYQLPASGTLVTHRVAISADGGGSFAPSVRSARKAFDVTWAPRAGNLTSVFLGDYVGFAAAGGRFMALWTGTYAPSAVRPGLQPDIYLARGR